MRHGSNALESVRMYWKQDFLVPTAPECRLGQDLGHDPDAFESGHIHRKQDLFESVHMYWEQDLLVAAEPEGRSGQDSGHDPVARAPVRTHLKKYLRRMTGLVVYPKTLAVISVSAALSGIGQKGRLTEASRK